MHIELLTIPGCPHSLPARELFARALSLEGIDPALLMVTEITTDAHAAAASFHGSPSFIIDGTDLFPSNAAPALSCRVYPSRLDQPVAERLGADTVGGGDVLDRLRRVNHLAAQLVLELLGKSLP